MSGACRPSRGVSSCRPLSTCHPTTTLHSPSVGGEKKMQGQATSQLQASMYVPSTLQAMSASKKRRLATVHVDLNRLPPSRTDFHHDFRARPVLRLTLSRNLIVSV